MGSDLMLLSNPTQRIRRGFHRDLAGTSGFFNFLKGNVCAQTSDKEYTTVRFVLLYSLFLMLLFGASLFGSCGDKCECLCKADQCYGFAVSDSGKQYTGAAFLCDKNAVCGGNSMCRCKEGYTGMIWSAHRSRRSPQPVPQERCAQEILRALPRSP
jgi:hypothetical protein